jgi:hypothetical protein
MMGRSSHEDTTRIFTAAGPQANTISVMNDHMSVSLINHAVEPHFANNMTNNV